MDIRNKKIQGIVISLILFIFTISGCGADNPKETKPPALPSAPSTGGQADPTSSDKAADDKQRILALVDQGQFIKEMSYTLVMTGAGISSESQVWYKDNRMKVDSVFNGYRSISLFDMAKGEVLSYTPNEKTATKIKLVEYQGQDNITPIDYIQHLDQTDFQFSGTETVNKVECQVISLTSGEAHYKQWINTENGLIVKVEEDLNGEKITIEFKDIHLGSIPDAIFDLPQGIEIMDLNAIMQNMPDMKTP